MSTLRQRTVGKLREELKKALDHLEAVRGSRKEKDAQAWVDEVKAELELATEVQQRAAGAAVPGPDAGGRVWNPGMKSTQGWSSFGEQLIAVARHYSGHEADGRLVRAPFGTGETDPSAGGFLVDTDFAQTVLTRAYDMGEILKRCFKLPISANSNGIKIPAVDEQSRATGSRWGGVQAYWIGEGDTITTSKPKFRIIELDLKKLAVAWTVTDELLNDSEALNGIATQAFSEEIMFMTENAVIRGTGAGQPDGILNAPCLVTVAKQKGQAASTFLWENITAMWSHMWMRSRQNAVWFINQDVEPQLYSLRQTIGTGGQGISIRADVPDNIYRPGDSVKRYGTLMSAPVIPIEYAATLGSVGDVILADFSQYVLADKKGAQAASSMHVRFLTDEMVFRITYRCDGEPIWNTPLTPFQGSSQKSPFIVLAART